MRERTREIGIRMALAAASARVSRAFSSGVRVTEAAAALPLAALPLLALLASLPPAGRATRIDAAEVLRAG